MSNLEELYTKEFLKIPVHHSVFEACKIMSENKAGAILIIEGVKVVGIFSERDLMNRVITKGLDPMKTPVSDVMTSDLFTVDKDTKPTVAIEVMHRKKIRHLPITDENKRIVGLINLRALLSFVIKNLAQVNRNMQEELDQLRFLNM